MLDISEVMRGGVPGILGCLVLSGLVVSPLTTSYTLEIIKMLTILSFQAWKLHPVKRGMSETLMEVDLLEEDIVGWVGKEKNLGVSANRYDGVCNHNGAQCILHLT